MLDNLCCITEGPMATIQLIQRNDTQGFCIVRRSFKYNVHEHVLLLYSVGQGHLAGF